MRPGRRNNPERNADEQPQDQGRQDELQRVGQVDGQIGGDAALPL